MDEGFMFAIEQLQRAAAVYYAFATEQRDRCSDALAVRFQHLAEGYARSARELHHGGGD